MICNKFPSVEDYIPQAIKFIKKELEENGEIESEYKGYIASFGASLIQSGLIPTIAFYSKDTESSSAKRSKITKIIYQLINEEGSTPEEEMDILKYILNNNEKETVLKEKVKRAVIALKLALRTFKLSGDNDD